MSVTVNLNNTERVMYQGNNHVKCIYGPNNQLLWTEEPYFTINFPYNVATFGLQSYGSDAPSITLYYWKNVEPNAARDNYTGTITANSSGQYISVNAGDIIKLYRPETTAWRVDGSNYVKFRLSKCDIHGNLASLFGYSSTIPEYACYRMFYFESVVDASGLILPWDTLSNGCYYGMFLGDGALTTAGLPILPATHLAVQCYGVMFRQCNNITDIAQMYVKDIDVQNPFYCMYQLNNNITSVTVPAFKSYNKNALSGMFWGCTGLTTATLNIPDNASFGYNACSQLFTGCTNLSNVTCLDTSPSTDKYQNWLNSVSATGTFTKATGVTWPSGASGIPTGWTIQDAA